MKKLLLLLLCVPLIFSCGNDLEKELTREERIGYTGKGTYIGGFGEDRWKYVGEWRDGKYHGQGTLTMTVENKNKYVGEWRDGKRNGQGTMTYKSGNIYVGEYKDNDMHGQGAMIFVDGGSLVGEFKDNNIHRGRCANADGEVFNYENGEFIRE